MGRFTAAQSTVIKICYVEEHLLIVNLEEIFLNISLLRQFIAREKVVRYLSEYKVNVFAVENTFLRGSR